MRDLSGADLRRIANSAGRDRGSVTYSQLRRALYDAAAQLDRCAEERAARAERAPDVKPLANGGTQ